MRDHVGEEAGNPNISSTVSSFNSNKNIRVGGKGAEEEDNMLDRKECEKAVFQHNLKLSRETNEDKQVILCSLLWEVFHSQNSLHFSMVMSHWSFNPPLSDSGFTGLLYS